MCELVYIKWIDMCEVYTKLDDILYKVETLINLYPEDNELKSLSSKLNKASNVCDNLINKYYKEGLNE